LCIIINPNIITATAAATLTTNTTTTTNTTAKTNITAIANTTTTATTNTSANTYTTATTNVRKFVSSCYAYVLNLGENKVEYGLTTPQLTELTFLHRLSTDREIILI
jgi:hypothetical protein